MSQLTWFAAGALALFLVIAGPQFFEGPAGRDAAKQDAANKIAPATKSAPAPEGGPHSGQGKQGPTRLTPREFYVLDRDRSGYLTADEVRGDALLEQNFARIDKNGDGRISLEEFTAFP